MRMYSIEDYLKLKKVNEITLDDFGNYIGVILSDNFVESATDSDQKNYLYIYNKKLKRILNIKDNNLHSLSFLGNSKILFINKNLIIIVDLKFKNHIKIHFDGIITDAKWYNNKVLFTGIENSYLNNSNKYENRYFYNNLYLLDFKRGIKKITKNKQFWEFDTNGKNIIALISDDPSEGSWYTSKLYNINLNGNIKLLYDPKERQIGKIRISTKNTISFIESYMSDRTAVSGDVIQIKNGIIKNLTEKEKATYHHIEFENYGNYEDIVLLKNEKSKFTIYRYYKNDIIWEQIGIVCPFYSPMFKIKNNIIVFSFSDIEKPPEIFILKNRNINTININFINKNILKYKTDIIEWKSIDGIKIYGIFKYKNLSDPLIVFIHGGPTSFSYISTYDFPTLFMNYGFSIFLPNFRGSVGLGRAYAELNKGDLGGKDFQDILDGIDYLRKSYKIKTENIYIFGHSYGGYISILSIMKTDIFKAAVAISGISDWVSFHGESILSEWDKIHFGYDKYKLTKYDNYSPIRIEHDVKTPILLMHGENDRYVPIGQSLEFYRLLRDRNKDVYLIIFPREGHIILEKNHVKKLFNETITFFNKYKYTFRNK